MAKRQWGTEVRTEIKHASNFGIKGLEEERGCQFSRKAEREENRLGKVLLVCLDSGPWAEEEELVATPSSSGLEKLSAHSPLLCHVVPSSCKPTTNSCHFSVSEWATTARTVVRMMPSMRQKSTWNLNMTKEMARAKRLENIRIIQVHKAISCVEPCGIRCC